MRNKFIDFVKLVEQPNNDNGHFYIVEGKKGKHYVSALFGREAKGLTIGTKLKLTRSNTKEFSAYSLTRV